MVGVSLFLAAFRGAKGVSDCGFGVPGAGTGDVGCARGTGVSGRGVPGQGRGVIGAGVCAVGAARRAGVEGARTGGGHGEVVAMGDSLQCRAD